MTHSARLTAFSILATATLACAKPAPPVDTQADVAAINTVREREITLVSAGKMDSLLALYTSDVQFMPPGEDAVSGQDGLRKWFEATLAQAALSGRYTSSNVTVSGDLAVDQYTGTLTATPKSGGAASEEHLKGFHIMKRQADGTWKIAQDLWNTDAPPPSAPPPATKK